MHTKLTIQLVLVVLLFVTSIPFHTYGADGQRKISQTPSTTFPITINQPGSYVLTKNLLVTDPNLNAIEITVNDVTLDLNGHMIQGPHTGPPWGGTGKGISAENHYSITIKNGKVWGFGSYGVYLYSVSGDPSEKGAGHWIDRVQVANNGVDGIVIYSGLVTNCSINNNGDDGLYAFDSTISNTVAHNNTWHGFNLSGCVITRCTANYNGNSGIFSDIRSRIEGNNLRYNGYGLYLNGTKNYAIKNIGSDNFNGNFYDVQSGTPGANYMPATVHNPPTTECSYNDNCGF